MRRLVITGAAGRIGSVLSRGLQGVAGEMRLVDVVPVEHGSGQGELVTADLRQMDAAVDALEGAEAIIHLAGIPTEDSFEHLLEANFAATYNVFEAARRLGVRRVVFASSNHATGMYPAGERIGPDDPVRPDTLYGVSKVFGESLGRLYADKHGLEVVCVRIGSFKERPEEWRELHTWLSHRDAIALFRACLLGPVPGFVTVYGASANTRSWWDDSSARSLGYEPVDDGERFAAELGGDADVTGRGDALQGGPFSDPGFTGRA